MIYLGFFQTFCDSWWLWWLLPFILGLLLGWALWAKWKRMYEEAQEDIAKLKSNIRDLEADLDECRKARAALDSDLALERGRMRECQARITELEETNAGLMASIETNTSDAGDVEMQDVKDTLVEEVVEEPNVEESKSNITTAGIAGAGVASLTEEVVEKDQLQMIEGIGPKMEEVLNENGIHNFCQLASRSESELRSILDKYGDKYKMIDPAGWIPQAKAACDGDFETMIKLQKADGSESKAERLMYGTSEKGTAESKSTDSVTKEDGESQGDVGDSIGLSTGATSLAAGSSKPDKYAKLKSDNLQIIEGIGPKMESVLKENGVNSWAALSSKTESDLRAILDKYGDKYKIIDPADWSAQASKANNGDWEGLISMQKADGSDSKAEKVMIKLGIMKQYAQDDLKAVEGIGPKIAELLTNNGISTWNELADTSQDKLQSILNSAGDRYKLADPRTWPSQAKLAAEGKWDELEAYQESLNGGK